jgi:hypothetical protein
MNDYEAAVVQLRRGNTRSALKFFAIVVLFATTVVFVYGVAATIPDRVAEMLGQAPIGFYEGVSK